MCEFIMLLKLISTQLRSNSIDNYKIQSGFMHHFLLVVDNKRILLVQQIRQKFFLHLIRYSLR
jgi:hypothetical protein